MILESPSKVIELNFDKWARTLGVGKSGVKAGCVHLWSSGR